MFNWGGGGRQRGEGKVGEGEKGNGKEGGESVLDRAISLATDHILQIRRPEIHSGVNSCA